MCSTSSQASVVSASDSKEPGCEPLPSARLMNTADQFLLDIGPASRSSETCESFPPSISSPRDRTSSVAGSPAKIFPMPASAPASAASAPVFGESLGALLANYDPTLRSWKTSQLSLLEDFSTFSETLPICGMMRNGACLELTILEPVSIESASGYWHTPTTRDFKGQSGRGNRERRGRNGKLHIANLCDQLVDFGRQDLVRSYTFREWLMGLPIGHTACEPSATPSSRKSRKSSEERS